MKSHLHYIISAIVVTTAGLQPVDAARIVLVAGTGSKADNAPAKDIKLLEPFAVDFDPAGNMVIAEMGSGNRLLRMDQKGFVRVIGGSGEKGYGGDHGPALDAVFNGMHNLAITTDGTIYLADTWNNRIRKLAADSLEVTTVAGTGDKGFSGDGGDATKAVLGGIYCATLDFKDERLYMADLHNRRIRYLNLKAGTVHAFAGNGQKGRPEEGAIAAKSPLVDPRAVAADRKGNVYILERGGHALRVVKPNGRIYTVVNAAGKKGATGDGGPAIEATMNGPKHICIDLEDNVIIADAENNLIRKYIPATGKIIRVAGNGKRGPEGVPGDPLKIGLARPHGVTVHKDGTLFITDSYNNRVLKIVD